MNMNMKKDVPTNTTGQEVPQGYMPWPMNPMGFYMPPNMQGMNYDPNSMGGQNPMYQMMPMYYMPYMQQQAEMEENMGKGKKTGTGYTGNQQSFQQPGTNEMNQQQNPMMPPISPTPYYYYNSQNPYPSMGYPGMMGNFMPNSNIEGGFPQMGYDMKNMNVKNTGTNEEPNQGFYGGYTGFGGYKQG